MKLSTFQIKNKKNNNQRLIEHYDEEHLPSVRSLKRKKQQNTLAASRNLRKDLLDCSLLRVLDKALTDVLEPSSSFGCKEWRLSFKITIIFESKYPTLLIASYICPAIVDPLLITVTILSRLPFISRATAMPTIR